MKATFSFENSVITAILIAVLTAGAAGYLAYNSLTEIVKSRNGEVNPELKMVLLKSIFSDLTDAESSVKSYSLSNSESYLVPFYNAASSLDAKIDSLYRLSKSQPHQRQLIDSISSMTKDKFVVLQELLEMQPNDRVQKSLNLISDKLEKKELEQRAASREVKSNIFYQVFGKKNPDEKSAVNISDVKKEIEQVKNNEAILSSDIKEKQLELTAREQTDMDHIRMLLGTIENQERDLIALRESEAGKLTAKTNRLIAVFCISVSVWLLIVGFFIVHNLRKNKEYREILKKAKEEAENLAHAKEIFLANMSHEIRTPMNAIVGFTEQVLQGPLAGEQKTQVEIVKKSAGHLLKIINDILDFSKLGAGKLEMEEIGFHPQQVFEESIVMMQEQADAKGLHISFSAENNIPHILRGDPMRLRQILLNVVGNAVKFTDKGKIKIHVSANPEGHGEVQLKIVVTDTGIGMHRTQLAKVFHEFEQAETNTSRKYGGTGLGLAITKKLIELQNGSIQIDSHESEGTTVMFMIPYYIGTYNDLPKEDTQMHINGLLKGKSVLIADDEPYNRKLLEVILKKWDVRITEAANGQEVVDALRREDFDAICLDIRMPVMNGLEAASIIRNKMNGKKTTVPIIALSAAATSDDITRCMEAGMNEFLHKPFKEAELYEKLLSVLNIKTNAKSVDRNIPDSEQAERRPANNLSELYLLANGDENFVKEMIVLFLHDVQEGSEKIKEAVYDESWVKIADYAHKIAPPARHIGADSIYELLNSIEDNARNVHDKEQLFNWQNELDTEIKKLTFFLENEIKQHA